MADSGELGRDAQDTQEWLVAKFKRHHKKLFRADGLTVPELVRTFRHHLKISMQFAVASGIGAMIVAAGHPYQEIGSL